MIVAHKTGFGGATTRFSSAFRKKVNQESDSITSDLEKGASTAAEDVSDFSDQMAGNIGMKYVQVGQKLRKQPQAYFKGQLDGAANAAAGKVKSSTDRAISGLDAFSKANFVPGVNLTATANDNATPTAGPAPSMLDAAAADEDDQNVVGGISIPTSSAGMSVGTVALVAAAGFVAFKFLRR